MNVIHGHICRMDIDCDDYVQRFPDILQPLLNCGQLLTTYDMGLHATTL